MTTGLTPIITYVDDSRKNLDTVAIDKQNPSSTLDVIAKTIADEKTCGFGVILTFGMISAVGLRSHRADSNGYHEFSVGFEYPI
jgi:hypothetical protein